MRKPTLVAVLVVMALPLFAGVALAADQVIYCHSVPCYGTGNDDKMYERPHNGLTDEIFMRGGHDLVLANGYTNDSDLVKGGPGHDTINVADGDTLDTASGGRGLVDWCIVDSRREVGRGCGRVTIR